jgi:hypothetical protein
VGNQREIRQTEPRWCLGAVIRVRAGYADELRALLEPLAGRYYTYYNASDKPVAFPNLDGPDVHLGVLVGDHVVIQSGGKMWCGYQDFIEHVRRLAPSLEDALFYVGDDEDYIDEFRIRSGVLEYERVHQGGWLPVEDFLLSKGRAP